LPDPPSYPQVELRAASMVDIPLLQVAIDESVEPVAATQAIDTRDLADSQPPATNASAGEPPEVDSYPFTRPRPVSGPRGVDRFPSASLQAKESGTVRINICVSTSGTVDSVEVTSSSGFPRLDRAALGIASEYRFKPAMRRGHPVAACAQYNIIFKVT
jgi:protein TonB